MDELHSSVENKPCILSLIFKFASIHPPTPDVPALEFSREKSLYITPSFYPTSVDIS